MSEMNTNPLVSVIVPVYNAAKYLRQTLDSICGQTLKDIEIILVDDGSTDESLSILKEYEQADSRITVLQQQNQYAGVARNNGMKIAKGKYFSFLDADDLFEPAMLEKMVSRAEETNADVVLCKADTFDQNVYNEGEAKPHNRQNRYHLLGDIDKRSFCPRLEVPSQLYQFTFGFAWDKLFRASTVRKYGYSFDPIPQCNDAGFAHSMIACADVCSIVEETLIHYRILNESVSHRTDREVSTPTALLTMKKNLMALSPCSEAINSLKRMAVIYAGGQLCNANNKYRENYIQRLIKEIEPEFLFLNERPEFYPERWAFDIYRSMVAPDISVVVPIYNAELYLHECLSSLKCQTYRNIEIICVNDGSTDSSLEILQNFAQNKDRRIRIINVPNGGYGKAMNLGLRAARGKYFAILEPDDYLPPNAYEILIKLAESHDLEIVRGKFCRFHTNEQGERVFKPEADYKHPNKVMRPRDEHIYFYSMSLATWTCLYNRDFLTKQDISYHESPGASYQDTGFFMQAFGYAERVMFTNETVYMYRTDNAASSTNTKSGKPNAMQNEFAFIKERYLSRPERWQNLQSLYLLRRMAAHRWMYNSIPDAMIAEYLRSFRKELINLQEVSRDHFKPIDKLHFEQLIVSPEHFLRNAGTFPGAEKVLSQLANPLYGVDLSGRSKPRVSYSQPAVSVIVPVYSGLEHFAYLVTLLRAQTLREMEFIFIDDCGTDGSFAIAELSALDDERIKLIRNEKNSGPGHSRNMGIAAASGEYIAFVDSDDIIPLDYYEKLYQHAKKTGAVVVKGTRARQYPDGRIEPSSHNEEIRKALAKGEHIVNAFRLEHTTAIYNREHVVKNGARNSESRQDEDTTFILMTLHDVTPEQVVITDEPCYYYRMHDASVTHVIDGIYLDESYKSMCDKLSIIKSLPESAALNKYAAKLVDLRVAWRYRHALQNGKDISDDVRRTYLQKCLDACKDFCQTRPATRLLGFAKDYTEGKTTISQYMNTVKEQLQKVEQPQTQKQPAIMNIELDARIKKVIKENDKVKQQQKEITQLLVLHINIGKLQRRYHVLRLRRLFAFGEVKKKCQQKIKRVKHLIRLYRELKRNMSREHLS